MFDFEALSDRDEDTVPRLLVVERAGAATLSRFGLGVVMRLLPTPIRVAVVGRGVLALAS